MDGAVLAGTHPSKEAADLVWELLVSYGEAVADYEQAMGDIHKTAYELAIVALADGDTAGLYRVYRDALVNAMIETDQDGTREHYQALLHFSNTVSTAFCEAQSDTLRKTIRHNRAESLSNELRIAKSIQSHLLPKVIPEIPGYQFAGRLVPAEEVGGDYWSIKHYPADGVVTMKLADISGHGVAAATLVAAVKFISGGYYRGSQSAADVIQQTNRVLTRETPHEILVTMVYGWLRPELRELTIVNAGHAPAFTCSAGFCADIAPTGPVLGITENADYEENVLSLGENDIVFFGSDGITEAGTGEQFGIERLKKLVAAHSHLTADEIADTVVRTVSEYARQPHDDVSLLVIKVTDDGG